jgi:carbonic anhydrase
MATPAAQSSLLSRRRFLTAAVAAGAAGLGTGLSFAVRPPARAWAQAMPTPDEALKALMDGHQRFLTGTMTSFERDKEMLRQKTALRQTPFAAILSCADSRVPVEIVFDQTIGDLFVARVAGNIATPEMIGSLEYGTLVLGARVLMVLGHSACGAVTATIAARAVPGQISGLYSFIRPAVDQAGTDPEAASKANVKYQVGLLRRASPVIAGLIGEKKCRVVGAYYDVASGAVTLLEP